MALSFGFNLFGTPNGKLHQCPDDGTKNIFEKALKTCNTKVQLTIYRHELLIYYIYIHEVAPSEYMGIVIVLNQAYFKDVNKVFEVFGKLYSHIAEQGKILCIEQTGGVKYAKAPFDNIWKEYEEIYNKCKGLVSDTLESGVESIEGKYWKEECHNPIALSEASNEGRFKELLDKYTFFHITQEESNEDTLAMQMKRLSEKNKTLEVECEKLKSQKKQYKIVALLSVLSILLLGGVFFLNREIVDRNTQINDYKDSIDVLDIRNRLLGEENTALNSKNKSLMDSVYGLTDCICGLTDSICGLIDSIDGLNDCQQSLLTENEQLQLDKKRLQSDINLLQNREIEPEYYYVYASSGDCADYYYKRGSSYYKTNTCVKDYSIIEVYYKSDKYALTKGGYLRLKDIRKKY